MKSAKDLKEMIDSCYTYGGADEDSYNYSRYILPYKKEVRNFRAVYKRHLAYLKANFKVEHGTSTDFEGCVYNSLTKI